MKLFPETDYVHEIVDGYNPAILKMFMEQSLASIGMSESMLMGWVHNGFCIRDFDVRIEMSSYPRKRMNGPEHYIRAFIMGYVSGVDGSPGKLIEDEIGRYSLTDYQSIATDIARKLFDIMLNSNISRSLTIMDEMSERGFVPESDADIQKFIDENMNDNDTGNMISRPYTSIEEEKRTAEEFFRQAESRPDYDDSDPDAIINAVYEPLRKKAIEDFNASQVSEETT